MTEASIFDLDKHKTKKLIRESKLHWVRVTADEPIHIAKMNNPIISLKKQATNDSARLVESEAVISKKEEKEDAEEEGPS